MHVCSVWTQFVHLLECMGTGDQGRRDPNRCTVHVPERAVHAYASLRYQISISFISLPRSKHIEPRLSHSTQPRPVIRSTS